MDTERHSRSRESPIFWLTKETGDYTERGREPKSEIWCGEKVRG